MKKITRNLMSLGLLALAALVTSCSSKGEVKSYNQGINIIPVPVSLTQGAGSFTLNGKTALVATDAQFAAAAAYLAGKVKGSTGYELTIGTQPVGSNAITFVVDTTVSNTEGYTLTSNSDGVVIGASTAAGAFYGMQTLLQLLPAEIESPDVIKNIDWSLPEVTINDYPRFVYRGLMLDVTRHFMDINVVKRHLDILAMFKLNRFHMHLTEDQLWAIEIKKFPELAKGSKRIEGDGSEYGGMYTQEQLKEVVAYAAERHIEVIPEIEMPGHAKAALVSHPELSCTGGPFEQPRIIWGVEDDVYCAGKEETFEFLEDILTEVAAIFPSQYIHIGGDECPKDRWSKCPDCQKRIQELGLKKLALKADENGKKHSPEELLQSYTIARVEKFANTLGKQIIGWDEILEGGLTPSATVMSWRGEEGGITAAMQGNDVVMTPNGGGLYIDHYQGATEVEPTAIGGYSTLEKVYSYNPIPKELPADKHKHILGAQANMWTEYVLDGAHADYMIFPRIIALSEVNWSPETAKDWNSFSQRINNAQVRMDFHNVNYHIPMPEGTLVDLAAFTTDSVAVPFNNTRNYPMVYTLDGSAPTASSSVYSTPLVFTEDATITIATLLPQGKLSRARTIKVAKQGLKAASTAATTPGVKVRVADGLVVTPEQIAAAQFGPESVVKYFTAKDKGPKFDMNKPSLAIYEGFIELPEDGVYGFATDMDELWIDGELLVSNGQECASRFQRNKTTRAMAAGKHPFKMVFNNMIKHGWPNNWNEITFYVKNPSSEKYDKVTPEALSN